MIRHRRGRRSGMTLTELLVVILIVGTLIALLLPGLGAAVVAGNITQARHDMRQIEAALNQYMHFFEAVPPTRQYTTSTKYDLDYCLPQELFPGDQWTGGAGYLEGPLEDPFQVLRNDSLTSREKELARGYRYKALGALSVNGAAPAGMTSFSVPADFPKSSGSKKTYAVKFGPDGKPDYTDWYAAPVRIVIWSAGPEGPPIRRSYSADGVNAEDPANWYPEKPNGIVCLYYTGKDWKFSY